MRHIDLKHHVTSDGRIVKTGNNQEIPLDEPMALFRGRDKLAVPLLKYYRQLCAEDGCNDFQLGQVDELVARFTRFTEEHADRMKQPGVTRGA